MGTILYLAERRSPSFQVRRSSVDIVCAGDSITGWNNFGGVECWPYRTYPEFLQHLCGSSGLIVANCGIAGEISPNGVGQVREYLALFPNARYFVLGYGSNDLDKRPEVETTSPRIVQNLDLMVGAVRHVGRSPLLLDVLDANESLLSREEAEALNRMAVHHNDRLVDYCRASRVPLVQVCGKLRDEHYADPSHPNDDGARIIAEEVFRMLAVVTQSGASG